jgi:ATP-dependent protease ClpP protease subunit
VFLSQAIDQSTLDRLTPLVLRLQAESRDPISLYIDSLGGNVYFADSLQSILRSLDQDGSTPCRLITVVTGIAGSAAADLLMCADYALAYPKARILCHGVSGRGQEALTRESASQLAVDLADSNEQFAIQLADNCISRFIFRVAVATSEFPAIRATLGNPNLSYASCFIEFLKGKISGSLVAVLEGALQRSEENDALDASVEQSFQNRDIAAMPPREFELHVLKTILDFEAQQHSDDPNWRFGRRGIERIHDRLQLLRDKYSDHHSQMIDTLCARWPTSFLTPGQVHEISQRTDTEQPQLRQLAAANSIRPLWFFFVSVCRSLQMDDYWMSAEEAYWLGLIDEVVGRTDLPCPRLFLEYPPENGSDQQEPASPAQ